QVDRQGVTATILRDLTQLGLGTTDASLAQEPDAGIGGDAIDGDGVIAQTLAGLQVVEDEARGDDDGYLRQPPLGDAKQQATEAVVEDLAEGAAAQAVVLHLLQAVEDEQTGAGLLQQAQHLLVGRLPVGL